MRKIILIILFIFIGCVQPIIIKPSELPKDIPIWIDISFSLEEKIQIISAIQEWNSTFKGEVVLNVVDINFNHETKKYNQIKETRGFVILAILSSSLKYKQIKDKEQDKEQDIGTIVGYSTHDFGGGTIYLAKDLIYPDNFRGITIHELAHLFGAKHTDHGLMNAIFYYEESTCVDYLTVLQVERAMEIAPGIMEPCP